MKKYVKSSVEEDLVDKYSFYIGDTTTTNYIVFDRAGYILAVFDDHDYDTSEGAWLAAVQYAKKNGGYKIETILLSYSARGTTLVDNIDDDGYVKGR